MSGSPYSAQSPLLLMVRPLTAPKLSRQILDIFSAIRARYVPFDLNTYRYEPLTDTG